MSNVEQPKRIRDRNQLIQSGYQGSSDLGTNALASAQPELTQSDILRLEKQVSAINTSIAPYSTFIPELQYAFSPDGYVNFDPILFPSTGGGTGTVFVQGTVTAYSSGTGTATVGAGSVSFTNTTGLGIFVGDVVLLGLQSGVYYLIGIISRSGAYTPPSYIAPSYTGFPLNGLVLGPGIRAWRGTGIALRTFVDYDASGILGLGSNCFVGWSETNGTYKVVAHSITSGITTDLGSTGLSIVNAAHPQLMIVGSALVAKATTAATQPIAVWKSTTGWVTTNTPGGTSNAFSRMTVSGTEYLVVSRSGVGWYYLDVSTNTWSGSIAFPAGATRVIAKDGYMWTNNGYVATAALAPSWTLRHSISLATEFDNFRADIAENGDLVVLTQFAGPPVTWGITTYKFGTSTSTAKAQLFTTDGLAASGEPQDLHRVCAGSGYIAVVGTIRADVIGGSSAEKAGAIWVTDGVSTATRAFNENVANFTAGTDYSVSGGYIRGSVVSGQVGLYTTTAPLSSTVDVKTF